VATLARNRNRNDNEANELQVPDEIKSESVARPATSAAVARSVPSDVTIHRKHRRRIKPTLALKEGSKRNERSHFGFVAAEMTGRRVKPAAAAAAAAVRNGGQNKDSMTNNETASVSKTSQPKKLLVRHGQTKEIQSSPGNVALKQVVEAAYDDFRIVHEGRGDERNGVRDHIAEAQIINTIAAQFDFEFPNESLTPDEFQKRVYKKIYGRFRQKK
jgi:hypothetical protein